MAFCIRSLDIILSLVLLLILAPLLLALCFLVFVFDGRPVFFCQQRVGIGLTTFPLIKLRTMRASPTGSGLGYLSSGVSKEHARAMFQTTSVNDSRITRLGRILRRYHLDEVPQLLNVLKGDMSLVGVRPDTPAQEFDYDPVYWSKRHVYRPGITGLAQIYSGINLERRTLLEEQWLSSPSVSLYLFCLLRTFLKVIKGSSI